MGRRRRPRPWRLIVRSVREMAARGRPADDLARRHGIALADVHRILEHRCIKGVLAGKVRLRHSIGWTAERIAAELHVDPEAVRTFLAPVPPPAPRQPRPIEPERLVPRQSHRRRKVVGTLNRARSPKEQAALSPWDRLELGPQLPPASGPELLPVIDLVEVPEEIPPATVEAREDWGPMQASFASGGDQGNAALSDAQAVEIRRRRAAGESRADVARAFNVSVATITRVTSRVTYRDAAAVEVLDLVEVIPATSPVPEQGERWEPEPGDRRRRGCD
jgi:Helix-turn-helix domain of resolvase